MRNGSALRTASAGNTILNHLKLIANHTFANRIKTFKILQIGKHTVKEGRVGMEVEVIVVAGV